jgi:hypothetical protein
MHSQPGLETLLSPTTHIATPSSPYSTPTPSPANLAPPPASPAIDETQSNVSLKQILVVHNR